MMSFYTMNILYQMIYMYEISKDISRSDAAITLKWAWTEEGIIRGEMMHAY